MRNLSVPPLLAALLFCAVALVPARGQEDPGALFMEAFSEYRAAEKLETDGRASDALTKYRYCASLLEQIAEKYPTYAPVVIEFRLGKSRESIARVEASTALGSDLPPLPSSIAPDSTPRAPAVYQRPLPPVQEMPSFRISVPGQPGTAPAPTPPRSFTGNETVIGRGAAPALAQQIEMWRGRVQQSERRVAELERQVQQERAEKQSAYKELDLTKVQVVDLKARLAQAGQKMNDLELANRELADQKAVDDDRIAKLRDEVKEVRADLEVAEDFNDELFAKVERAAAFIEKSEAIREQLLTERRELAREMASGSGEDVRELRNQLDQLIAENEEFKKAVARVPELEATNADLAAKLAEAEKREAELIAGQKDGEKIKAELIADVDRLNATIASLRDELDDGRVRLADLERQFEETSAATTAATGAMASENELLKEIISRQMEEQAKRQQARKLVAEELAKLSVDSTTLLDRFTTMAGAEVELSADELRLIRKPEAAVATNGGASGFELVAGKSDGSSELPEKFANDLRAADEASKKADYETARTIYQDIAKQAPDNFLAAVNLGIASHHLQDYDLAIESFQHALKIKPNEPSALTNLGISELRNGNLENAKQCLQKAIANGGNHLAHYFLGLALQLEGDTDAAMLEAKKSIELNPDYGPAIQLEHDLEASGRPPAAAAARPQG